MQNRYVGDIGDFGKYGLLRALSEGRQLGVAWYLYPNEAHNADGSLTEYLSQQGTWRDLDPQLFNVMREIVYGGGRRSVARIKNRNVLPGAVFADKPLKTNIPPGGWRARRQWRTEWFKDVIASLADCDIVFADPDNGLFPNEQWSASKQKDWKRLPLKEAQALSEKRTAVLYHHNTRRRGGHYAEICHWMQQLPGCTHAFYWRRCSNRTFFIINPDCQIVDRLIEFAHRWQLYGCLITRANFQ